jgi:NAD(P)-dependent dehydrogenase (short-subunit alcohol dehydrogenase family)
MLEGKTILVTGGASGIGLATCKQILSSGASVALWDLDHQKIKEAVNQLDPTGQRCRGFSVDVTNSSQVSAALEHTTSAFGELHGAFNNAGIGAPTVPLADLSESDFDKVMAVDLKGVWLCMKHELLYFQKHGGSIVNNASVAGLVGLSGQGAYTAAKHGVIGLTKTAAVEYASAGVRVNAICPGAVRTPILEHFEKAGVDESALAKMAPMGRIGNTQEIANAVIWLLSDQASFVTGASLSIDGGWSAQ